MKRLLVYGCVLFSFALNGQTDSRVHRARGPSRIRSVLFKNAGALSAQERRELAKEIRQDDMQVGIDRTPKDISGVAENAAELVREACEDKGYLKVNVSTVAEPVTASASNPRFDIVVAILSYGQQYRLGEITFVNANVFPEAELVKLIPVAPGEIFSRAKIAKGLEALQQRYFSAGYINFVLIPNTEFDETDTTARLNIDVDEGNLFRWGELQITGLGTRKAQELTDGWEALRGKTYSQESLKNFCAKFFRSVPADTDPAKYTTKHLNPSLSTVDIYIKFVSPWF